MLPQMFKVNPMPDTAPAQTPSLAVALDISIRAAFQPVIDRLTADGVPPVITAQAMMRIATDIIHTAHGETELRQTITETLDIILSRQSPRISNRSRRSGSTRK